MFGPPTSSWAARTTLSGARPIPRITRSGGAKRAFPGLFKTYVSRAGTQRRWLTSIEEKIKLTETTKGEALPFLAGLFLLQEETRGERQHCQVSSATNDSY
jgi:hypothetical protein